MDRKFNDFSKFKRGKDYPGSDRDKFRGMIEDVRGRSRANSDAFRDGFRGNAANFRENLRRDKAREKPGEEKAVVREEDKDGFTEDFHERQVDYHKDVRKKKDGEE